MAPKEDNKAKAGTVTVNIDDFTRTRDSVLVSLAQLNSAVADLSRAYINHANTALGRNPADLDLGIINSGITNALYENGLIARPSSPGAKSEAGAGDKKKRKRSRPDPEAPKRALTPYFLYMQNNRPQIAADLGGDGVKPKDVAEEGTRRWANMPDVEKSIWKKLYQENLEDYRNKMNKYKQKKEQEKAHEQDQAASSQLQQEATAEPSQAGSDEESGSEEEENEEEGSPSPSPSPSPEPAKEPSPPRSSNKQRRRSDATKITKAVEESPVANKSPEKKKRGPARKEKEQEPPASARKTAETKRPRKKRKSDAGEE